MLMLDFSPPRVSSHLLPTGVTMSLDAIDQLEGRIRELRIEFERYFNGALAIPPLELRDGVQGEIKRLRNRPGTSFADHYRLQGLEARFNSLSELSNRRLREREEGRSGSHRPSPEPPRFDLNEGISFGDSFPEDAVYALYHGLRGTSAGPRFDLMSFKSYLAQQTAAIQAKTGCSEVRFRVVHEDGQPKLKAKPIKAP